MEEIAQPWITFDCFGTLVDWHSGLSEILEPWAGSRTAELLRAYHRLEPQFEASRPHQSYKAVLTGAIRRAAEEMGIPLSKGKTDLLLQSWSAMPVFDDVEAELALLRANGYKLAVLTNCDEDLFEQTHRRFQCRFDLVVTAERVQDYKPSLSHFRFFSRVSGINHDAWIHAACSWFHDIAPARELGIRHIWIDRESRSEDASTVSHRLTSIRGLTEAADLLLKEAKNTKTS